MTTCSNTVLIPNCCKNKQVFNTFKDIVNDYNKQYKERQEYDYKWYSEAD